MAQVKETSPTEPAAETAQVLVETENVFLDAAREKPVAGRGAAGGRDLRAGSGPLPEAVLEEATRAFPGKANASST